MVERDPLVVIAPVGNSHLDAVRQECAGRGVPVLVFESNGPAAAVQVTSEDFELSLGVGRRPVPIAELARCPVLYLPVDVRMPCWVADPYDDFSAREWDALIHSALLGWHAASEIPWLIKPGADLLGDRKVFLLQQAARAGLRVPRTVIATTVNRAELHRRLGPRVVVKAINLWQEVGPGRHLHTAELTPAQLAVLDGTRLETPALFQELVSHRVEHRVYLARDVVVCLRSTAADHAPVDFRLGSADQVSLEVVDESAARPPLAGLRRLMAAVGLEYCVFDIAATEAGPVVLDVNPAGSWSYLIESIGVDLTPRLLDAVLR